jgi:glycosyltransferase involved in cell wall biosynthesis
MKKYKITIFTPTYNRAHLLERLYRSIQRQTFRDFEWLIVDDGSKDNTEDIVSVFLKENNTFPIRYYKKENGGKSRAVNFGLDLAEGELFFIMDSDDYLTDDALEKIVYWESTIENKSAYCGVAGNRGTTETETPNVPLPGSFLDCSVLEKYAGNTALLGEHAEALYTDVFRKFKYPEFEGEKYMTPCVAFDRMAAAGYITRYFQDIIWVCNYLDDGLTLHADTIYVRNPRGYGLTLHERMVFANFPFPRRFKSFYSFYCELQDKYSYQEIASFIHADVKLMYLISIIYKAKRKLTRT